MRHNTKNNKMLLKGIYVIFIAVFVFSISGALAKPAEKKKPSPEKKTEDQVQQVQGGNGDDAGGITEKDYTENDFKPQVEEESYAWLVFKTMMILGLLIGGFYFFFRYVTKKTGMQLLGQNVVNVLSVVPIGQNKYLQIVDLAGKMLVLGISENNINLITEITNKDEISRIQIQSQKNPPPGSGGFQDYLSRHVGRIFDKLTDITNRKKGSGGSSFYESGQGFDNLIEHQERLKKLNGYDKE